MVSYRWQINKGREELKKIREQEARSKEQAATSKKPKQEPEAPAETREPVVPTQAGHLREVGTRLRIGAGVEDKDKDAIKLDAIIHYVQGTANLDELDSV